MFTHSPCRYMLPLLMVIKVLLCPLLHTCIFYIFILYILYIHSQGPCHRGIKYSEYITLYYLYGHRLIRTHYLLLEFPMIHSNTRSSFISSYDLFKATSHFMFVVNIEETIASLLLKRWTGVEGRCLDSLQSNNSETCWVLISSTLGKGFEAWDLS